MITEASSGTQDRFGRRCIVVRYALVLDPAENSYFWRCRGCGRESELPVDSHKCVW